MELSIEEKAKRYDEAIKKAEALYKKAEPMSGCNVILETIFHELAESEDEKILKGIRSIVEHYKDEGETCCPYPFVSLDEVLNWLEKQGKKQQKTPIWKHWKNGIAGNGEGKPIYLTKDGYTYRLSSLLSFECDYIELSELDKLLSEKQGEQKPVDEAKPKFHIGDKIRFFRKGTTNEEPMTITKIDEKGYWSDDLFICNFIDADRRLKLVEQKSADKVEPKQEPKFKTGTYVVYLNDTYMLEDDGKHYILTSIKKNTSTPVVHIPYGDEDYTMKEWTIQDAKDGDILMANAPFIFNGNLEGGSPGAHCGINTLGEFQIPEYPKHWTGHTTTPATKEQRELLFQKMKEAGYEWNAEKKELMKNIEQKPAWSEEDEYTIERLLCLLDNEQDKYPQLSCYFQEIEGIKDWLKSLKPQNKWKPSDEQMKRLSDVVHKAKYKDDTSVGGYSAYMPLASLYLDLKKLREELLWHLELVTL